MNAPKLLIVKTGLTELLTDEDGGGPSLGDVFRTTCILEEFQAHHVTWLTSASAISLLPGAPHVDQPLADPNRASTNTAIFDFKLLIKVDINAHHWPDCTLN